MRGQEVGKELNLDLGSNGCWRIKVERRDGNRDGEMKSHFLLRASQQAGERCRGCCGKRAMGYWVMSRSPVVREEKRIPEGLE